MVNYIFRNWLTRRSKILVAFIGLALGFLILFSIVFYFASNQEWKDHKKELLSGVIQEVTSLEDAETNFSDIRVISPDGNVIANRGIFEFIDPSVHDDSTLAEVNNLYFFIVSKKLSNGTTLLFADDVTDAVEIQKLMFQSLALSTSLLILLAVWVGWIFTREIFKPVQTIVDSIEEFELRNPPKKDAIDISGPENDEFVRIARNLEDLYARLRIEATRLEDLSANIAHELKNGLFEIASTLELANLHMGTQIPSNKLSIAQHQVHRLSELVQSLLLLANKDLKIHKEPTLLVPLLEASIPKLDAEPETIPQVIVHCPKNLTWQIYPEFFEILLRNIIGNAIKFTKPDGKIGIFATESEIRVSDTGIGIPEKDLPFVFDRFYKSSDSRTNGTGHGLGLALAQHIAQLHGMTIHLESEVNIGTTVTIRKSNTPNPDLSHNQSPRAKAKH